MSEAPAPTWLKVAAIGAVVAIAAWAAVEAPTVYDPANGAGQRDVCAKLDCAIYPSPPTPKRHPMPDHPTGKTPMKETEADKAVRDSAFRVTGAELRAFIERIERLAAEKKDLADQQKEVFAEAKGRGYDTKIIRRVIALRKREPDDIAEEEAVLELYKEALGMA
jgi:uncharacterized protein (UPF0335 family)